MKAIDASDIAEMVGNLLLEPSIIPSILRLLLYLSHPAIFRLPALKADPP
ncbi:MAG TPA: hypothetical protein PKY20_04690 [Methanothrix sp.]|nr:hypothetical protein [Methanothrix sp.]HQE97479.1 hypothetical protein [Methanothrix sp.]HUM81111.1 hypothetical protein [Methanothrix sp.]